MPPHRPLPAAVRHDVSDNDLVASTKSQLPVGKSDSRSSFPYLAGDFYGGSAAAFAHLARYFESRQVDTYKATRNGLSGVDYSSKLSPWLASGAISARTVDAALKEYEVQHGANDGTLAGGGAGTTRRRGRTGSTMASTTWSPAKRGATGSKPVPRAGSSWRGRTGVTPRAKPWKK